MTVPRPGWYPDPEGVVDRYRWWDGTSWCDDTSDTAQAPPPRRAEADVSVPVSGRSRRRSRVVTAVTLTVCSAMVLAAGAGMMLLAWRDAGASKPTVATRSAAAPNTAVAPSAAGPGGKLDERTRLAVIGAASMLLPAEPYQVHPDPLSVNGLLDVAFVAEADVHRRADGGPDWAAMVALTSVSRERTTGGLARTAKEIVEDLAGRMYGTTPARLGDLTMREFPVDDCPGVLVTARAHYEIKQLPSRYDDLTAVVVALDDGTTVAAISSVPNDAGQQVTALAAGSLATLTVQE